jgi:hypothetical protein
VKPLDIPHQRQRNQHLTGPGLKHPAEVVSWLVAVQAQDYAGAKWALGLRMRSAADQAIEQAFTSGSILRTHLMRPTWHFVSPADIRWLLALTAPRVHQSNAFQYRKLELGRAVLRRSAAALEQALQGGRQATREQLRGVLEHAGVHTRGPLRLGYILMYAELEGIVCSGPRRGKQFTYALLEERVPPARALLREEALAELARRYFMSHGPATLRDLAKWSGLTIADARRGLEAVRGQLEQEVASGQEFWFAASALPRKGGSPQVLLLPNYDEYTIGYRDHSAVFDLSRRFDLVYGHVLVIDGRVVGTWRRTLQKTEVVIQTNTFAPLSKAESRAVVRAADRYGAFLGLPVVLPMQP